MCGRSVAVLLSLWRIILLAVAARVVADTELGLWRLSPHWLVCRFFPLASSPLSRCWKGEIPADPLTISLRLLLLHRSLLIAVAAHWIFHCPLSVLSPFLSLRVCLALDLAISITTDRPYRPGLRDFLSRACGPCAPLWKGGSASGLLPPALLFSTVLQH